ncbi:MAG: DUF2330 domain-containing protein [Planctomycetes bacterium]|nr:DUF2330 domain-containing protein [Planctomycetota bacterium]
MLRILVIASILILAAAMLCLVQPDAEGCAGAPRRGYDFHIAEESAIIIWDPVKKIEHFIRSATIDTKSPDFGFLVPTPAKPVLKEVENIIFSEATSWMRPKIVAKNRFVFAPVSCCFLGMGSKSAMRNDMAPTSKSVRILGEQEVGGFKSVILEADNTEDLSNWLKDNGYSNDPELQSWLFPYVTHKWKITAFKIIQDPKTGKVATTKPVRMSFATDRPFFPYREPEEKKKPTTPRKDDKDDKPREPGGRLLRVFFISGARMEGKLGDAAWHAKVPWSDQLTSQQRATLPAWTGVPDDEIPANAWMTTFEDRASPRPGKEEVYFDPAADPTPVRPEVIHYTEIWIPIDCTLVCALLVFGLAGLIVKKRQNRTRILPMNREGTT